LDFTEKKISHKDIFKGNVVHLHVDTVSLSDGSEALREIAEHVGGAVVLPVDDAGGVYLVRQFRYAVGQHLLEAPAGALNAGEAPLVCAMRELAEETGLTARNYEFLGEIYPSPGYCREALHLYLATGLERGEAQLDEGELLLTEKHRFDEIFQMALKGEIKDAKTALAVLRAAPYLDRKGKN